MADDPEAWTHADTAPVPSRVFQNGPLLIDAEITKRRHSLIPPKVRDEFRDHSIPIGRRALEVAILSACRARAANPPREEWEPGWVSIHDEAKNAARAIQKTLRALNPNGKSARMFRLPLSQARLGKPTVGTNVQGIFRSAESDASVLIAAEKILSCLANDSERRRREITARLPAKSSDVEKHAFVFILYEAWIVLMGKRPGSSPIAAQNPFLRFVEAAWQDWRGENAIWDTRKKGTQEKISFVRSLNVALAKVTETRKKLLLAAGPSWLQLELNRAHNKA
jgi:hypothetical protein